MPQQTVYIRDADMGKWRSTQKKADLVAFALTLTDNEIETIKKLRQDRDAAIKLPAPQEKTVDD